MRLQPKHLFSRDAESSERSALGRPPRSADASGLNARARVALPRKGMTLIELLVVCGVIAALGAISIAFMPSVHGRDGVVTGANQLQSWLSIAKQRALRDGAPRGLRLIKESGQLAFRAQYIELPEDYRFDRVYREAADGMTVTVVDQVGDPSIAFSGGFSDPTLFPVQPNDFIEFIGELSQPTRGPHRIVAPITPGTLTLLAGSTPPVILSGNATDQYVIIRGPRVLTGEADVKLPPNIAVDFSTNAASYGEPVPVHIGNPNYVDILFTPSGPVLYSPSDKIQLWVRDSSRNLFEGDQILVTVYARTGMISTNAVDLAGAPGYTAPASPYSFTRDGRPSGF